MYKSFVTRTYAVAPQTVVGAGFFRDFSLVAQSLDKPYRIFHFEVRKSWLQKLGKLRK
jgi:hypothetical protein